MSQRYPTDLTEAEWTLLVPLIPAAKRGGRPRTTEPREVVNAILYSLRSGCQWRMLPTDFPPYQTVSLNLSEFVAGRSWSPYERGGHAKARVFSGNWLSN